MEKLETKTTEITNTTLNKSSVQVASCTLSALLNCKQFPIEIEESSLLGQLFIPEYQRPYIWKEKQINQLLNDFIEYSQNDNENKPMYYLGTIILHQDGDKLKIIDGQQRITTALLFQKIKDINFTSGISYSSSISIKNIKHNLSYLKAVADHDIFEYRDVDVLNLIDFEDINVTLIITTTEDLAYTFFETQNTGGVRLEGSDILKAHHLRAIPHKKVVNYQAKRWESIDSANVEKIVQLLTKIRFWDNRKWRLFPFYKNIQQIKEVIIDEYTLNTLKTKNDISYYYSAVKNEGGRQLQMHESSYKQLKQPLSDGNNTLDYVNDYIHLYEILFGKFTDYRVDDAFYDFRDNLLHGKDGTLFLKELFEIAIICYVSRFGFFRLFEASLWLYRAIYSMRVSKDRNVREDSVFKFIYDNQFVDNILEVFTTDELFLFLKKFSYEFNTKYTDGNTAKVKHINALNDYFPNFFHPIESYKKTPLSFDKHLILAITQKI